MQFFSTLAWSRRLEFCTKVMGNIDLEKGSNIRGEPQNLFPPNSAQPQQSLWLLACWHPQTPFLTHMKTLLHFSSKLPCFFDSFTVLAQHSRKKTTTTTGFGPRTDLKGWRTRFSSQRELVHKSPFQTFNREFWEFQSWKGL